MALIFYSLAGICGLVALIQLRHLRKTRNQLMFFIFLTASLALLIYQLLFDGLFLRLPHLFLVMNVFALMAIASIYDYARWLVDTNYVLTRKRIFAVLGLAAVYAAILSPFWFLRAQEKVMIVGEIIQLTVLYTRRDPLILGISVFKISNAYFALVGLVAFILSCKVVFIAAMHTKEKLLRYAAVFLGLSLLTAFLGTAGIALNSLTLIIVAGILLSVVFCGLYVVGELTDRKS